MAGARSVDVILGSREKDMTNLVNKQKHATIELFNLSRKSFCADRRKRHRISRTNGSPVGLRLGLNTHAVSFFIIALQH